MQCWTELSASVFNGCVTLHPQFFIGTQLFHTQIFHNQHFHTSYILISRYLRSVKDFVMFSDIFLTVIFQSLGGLIRRKWDCMNFKNWTIVELVNHVFMGVVTRLGIPNSNQRYNQYFLEFKWENWHLHIFLLY